MAENRYFPSNILLFFLLNSECLFLNKVDSILPL